MGLILGLINTVFQSFGNMIAVILIILITIFLAKLVSYVMKKFFQKSSKTLKIDSTHYLFFRHSVSAIIMIIGFSLAIFRIPALKSISVSLLAGAGILAVAIGFASQSAFSNIISGIFLVIFKPFRVGDRIGIEPNIYGVVEDINLRHTTIRNFENKRLIIPNSVISNEKIQNDSIGDEKVSKWIDFGISYDSDITKAKKIMEQEALKHPECIDNRSEEDKLNNDPIVKARVRGFGDSSVNLRVAVWTKNPAAAWKLGCDLNESIKKRFDKEGIEIPFPYRTVVFKDKKTRKKK